MPDRSSYSRSDIGSDCWECKARSPFPERKVKFKLQSSKSLVVDKIIGYKTFLDLHRDPNYRKTAFSR
jgi:hypothetical protein